MVGEIKRAEGVSPVSPQGLSLASGGNLLLDVNQGSEFKFQARPSNVTRTGGIKVLVNSIDGDGTLRLAVSLVEAQCEIPTGATTQDPDFTLARTTSQTITTEPRDFKIFKVVPDPSGGLPTQTEVQEAEFGNISLSPSASLLFKFADTRHREGGHFTIFNIVNRKLPTEHKLSVNVPKSTFGLALI